MMSPWRTLASVSLVALAGTGACSGGAENDGASGSGGQSGASGKAGAGGSSGSSHVGGNAGADASFDAATDASEDATANEAAAGASGCGPEGPGCFTCGQVFNFECSSMPSMLCGWSTTTKSAEKFDALVDCMCAGPCAAECDAECGGRSPNPTCPECLKTACKAENDVCNDDDGT